MKDGQNLKISNNKYNIFIHERILKISNELNENLWRQDKFFVRLFSKYFL